MWPVPWLRDLLRPAQADAELDDEIRFHIERLTDELVARGLSAENALLQARREFGGVEQVREACRDLRALRWLESVYADLRYGWRTLGRTPAFTVAAVASLAIGIGANTAIFSLADATLLRRLPVQQPEQLVELVAVHPDGHSQTNLPADVFEHVRRQPIPFIDLFATVSDTVRVRMGPGQSEPTGALFVSGNYFSILGTRAKIGRLLLDEDDRPGSPRVVVLSHLCWRTHFGGRAGVVGQTLWLDGTPTTVVGVAAPDFFGVDRSFSPGLFLPLSLTPPTAAQWIVGRLRPGVSIASAEAQIAPLYARGIEAMRGKIARWPAQEQWRFRAQRVRLAQADNGTVALRWQLGTPLRVLAGAVLLVLAIACTNVTALQLSRGERRVPEIALRLSLGAGRSRVIRQLLTESALLAALAAAAGLGLGYVLHRLLVTLSPLDPSAALDFRLDGHILAIGVVLCALTALATGLFPALRLTRLDTYPVLKGERTSTSAWRSGPRRAILVTQIAATVVLLTGAGLLVRSLGKLTQVDTGFDRRNLLLVRVDPSASRLDGRPAAEWGSQLSERVRALPGVRSVALAANTVFTGRESWILTAWVDGYSYAPGERQTVGYNEVGPGFFATAGILLLAGREFLPSDRAGMPEVAIVNHAFARKYFGDRDPVGHRFGTRGDAITRYEIVGVTVDTKIKSLHESPWPAIYLPLLQQERHGPLVLHVRGSASVTALAPAVRRAVAGVDPDLEIRRVNTLDVAVGETLRGERMLATLLALFAAVTLLLTAVGLYGSMAYAATRRTAEIGIRMALGASEGRICAWMLREASFVVAAGALVGVTVAALALGSLRSLLFQVGTWDPISFGAALLSVVVVGLAAAVLPARRAARRPPMIALRHE